MNNKNDQKQKKVTMEESLKSILDVIQNKHKLTGIDGWRIAGLCISQGIDKIVEAKEHELQVAERRKQIAQSDHNSKEFRDS